ncbi:MAG TPA: hypothetical protein VK674_02595 [Candidatus Limnocylindria bacterium]|nr:hypothetical protein [Candidatus Limnocylindria bacterium]
MPKIHKLFEARKADSAVVKRLGMGSKLSIPGFWIMMDFGAGGEG